MSFMYKTILRAEKHSFDWIQQRFNSKKSFVIAFDKGGDGKSIHVADLDNKTGEVSFKNTNFKPATLNRIKQILTS